MTGDPGRLPHLLPGDGGWISKRLTVSRARSTPGPILRTTGPGPGRGTVVGLALTSRGSEWRRGPGCCGTKPRPSFFPRTLSGSR